MPSTTLFDIVLVPFPFTDLSTTKRRPCLVLAEAKPRGLPRLFVVAMMTSQTKSLSFPYDVSLQNWELAGLPKATLVRLAKVVTLEETMIRKKIGRLDSVDQKLVRAQFAGLFAPVLKQ